MEELLKYLAAGGSITNLVLVIIMWRLDRRLVRIETRMGLYDQG